ncbi:TPA: hypothetical protein PXQ54_003528 [Yersinia enterocolitica]|nr:hypothetical protein [Yersinia enterocolitica]HDL8162039.1 hypothetical protein [Yersinia enterocolitica]
MIMPKVAQARNNAFTIPNANKASSKKKWPASIRREVALVAKKWWSKIALN